MCIDSVFVIESGVRGIRDFICKSLPIEQKYSLMELAMGSFWRISFPSTFKLLMLVDFELLFKCWFTTC